jgi:hypothetical protein
VIGSEFGRTPFGLAAVQHAARVCTGLLEDGMCPAGFGATCTCPRPLPPALVGYEDDEQQPHEDRWRCPECGLRQRGAHGPNTLCSQGFDAAVAAGWATAA